MQVKDSVAQIILINRVQNWCGGPPGGGCSFNTVWLGDKQGAGQMPPMKKRTLPLVRPRKIDGMGRTTVRIPQMTRAGCGGEMWPVHRGVWQAWADQRKTRQRVPGWVQVQMLKEKVQGPTEEVICHEWFQEDIHCPTKEGGHRPLRRITGPRRMSITCSIQWGNPPQQVLR